jgi:hypothetical protein
LFSPVFHPGSRGRGKNQAAAPPALPRTGAREPPPQRHPGRAGECTCLVTLAHTIQQRRQKRQHSWDGCHGKREGSWQAKLTDTPRRGRGRRRRSSRPSPAVWF